MWQEPGLYQAPVFLLNHTHHQFGIEVRMIYFSQLINQQIWDGFGSVVGKLEDILIDATERKMPPIVALSLKNNSSDLKFIPAYQIASLWPSITLKIGSDKIGSFTPTGHELLLLDRVLDQQIVDTEGKRLVRVNDLQLARAGNQFVLTGVDVSGQGLLRRLGLEKIGRTIGWGGLAARSGDRQTWHAD